MSRHQVFLAAAVIIIFPILSFGQIEYLSFEPLDSIQIEPTALEIYDINNDNIDDLIIGTNGSLKVFDGVSCELMWEDTENLNHVTAIEVGDIENDGLPDYFVGHHYGSDLYLTVFFGANLNNPINWPGALNGSISNIHFYNYNDTAYINIIANGTFKINLISWAYTYYNQNYYPIFNSLYYSIRTINIMLDTWARYIYTYSFAFQEIADECLVACYASDIHTPYALGRFMAEEEAGFYLYRTCLPNPYGGNPDISLYLELWNTNLYQIGEIHYPELYYARKFVALNVFGDLQDELLLTAAETDTLDNYTFLLNSDGSIHARSALNDSLNIITAGNLDDDEYDEIICTRNSYLVIIDLVNNEVEILEQQFMPKSFSVNYYPNPFNSQIKLDLISEEAGHFKIEILNILGQRVELFFDGFMLAGKSSFIWQPNESNTSSGIYLLKISGNGHSAIERMVYLK